MSQPVAVKQILFHQGCLFMVDAAGQLWYSWNWHNEPPVWKQIERPSAA